VVKLTGPKNESERRYVAMIRSSLLISPCAKTFAAERYVSPYMLAVISAGLGDRAKSFTYLQTAYTQKSTDLAYFIKADFRLDELRSDARFANLIARVAPPGMEH
jgi:hypothetical protein